MRRLKKLGLFFLILLAIAAVGLFILHRIGVSKLASRGGGTIPTADELEYPDLTDAENAAILYRAAWKALDAILEGADNETFLVIDRYPSTILARAGIGEESKDVPDAVPRSGGISRLFQRKADVVREESLSESELEVVGGLLAELDPMFEFLRQARTTKGCLFLNDHSPEAANENVPRMMETGGRMRGLATYVVVRALWEAEQGNTDAALDWIATGLHLANDLNDESTLIGELLRTTLGIKMLSAAQGILYSHPISGPIPQALQDEIDDLRDRSRFGDGLRREAALFEALAHPLRGTWSPLLIMSEGNYLETLGAFIEAIEEEDYSERTRRIDALSGRANKSSKGFRKFVHHYEEAGTFEIFMISEESLETLTAKCDLLELSLSLRAYEQTHGAFPETLDDLTPEFLPAIPEDPLNGKAYLYEKSDQRITVRSEETTKRGKEIAFHLAPLANTPETQ